MSIKRASVILILIICGLFGCTRTVQAQDDPRFVPSACPFSNITAIRIDCGWLTVRENHAQPTGATIRLAIAIIRASSATAAPDPVIYLAGGPGAGVVWMAPRLAVGLAQSNRDLVLIDQRGMGLSEPGLYCPDITEWMLMSGTPLAAQIEACRAELIRQGVHPEMYTTEENAADIALAIPALGYIQANLFGISYGTRLALNVLRDHPEHLRSVVLDSTHPPQIMYNEDSGAIDSFERSFRIFEGYCAIDLFCHAAYPDLEATYRKAWAGLNDRPMLINVDGTSVRVTGKLLETLVYSALYRPNSLAILPALIYGADERDEIALRTALKPIVQPSGGQGRSLGATLTVLCTENALLTGEQSNARPPQFSDPFPAINGSGSVENCRAWGVTVAVRPAPAMNDHIPVLVMAGEFDPVTPPEWGASVAKGLAKAVYVRFPNLGHGVTDNQCAGAIYARFLDDPTAQPDVTCLSSIAAPAFALDAARTTPGVLGFTALFASIGAVGLISAGRAAAAGRYRFTWRVGLRQARVFAVISIVGLILIASGLGVVFLRSNIEHMVQTIIPLAAGVQAALAFASDDEPGLEVQLAAPRGPVWLIVERLIVVVVVQGGIALVGTCFSLIATPDQDALIAFARWSAPLLLLSGIGLYATLRTRLPLFGALIVGIVWFGFSAFNEFFEPGRAFAAPLNIVQPFMWTIHAYLEPGIIGVPYYWVNRVAVSAAGIALIVLACRQVINRETALMRSARKQVQKGAKTAAHNTFAGSMENVLRWTPQAVRALPLRQFATITRFEYLLMWRKRTALVIALILFVAVLLSATLLYSLLSSTMLVNPTSTAPEQARHMATLGAIMSTWTLLSVMTIFIAPLAVSETVALDRRSGMSELLGGLPLRYGVYLAGKVTGVTLALLVAFGAALVFSLVIWTAKTGGLEWPLYLDMWLVGGGLSLVLNIPIAVLLGATQPTRVRAAGFVFAIFAIFAMIAPLHSTLLAATPARTAMFDHYLGLFGQAILDPVNRSSISGLSVPSIQAALLAGVLEIGALAFFVHLEYRNRKIRG